MFLAELKYRVSKDILKWMLCFLRSWPLLFHFPSVILPFYSFLPNVFLTYQPGLPSAKRFRSNSCISKTTFSFNTLESFHVHKLGMRELIGGLRDAGLWASRKVLRSALLRGLVMAVFHKRDDGETTQPTGVLVHDRHRDLSARYLLIWRNNRRRRNFWENLPKIGFAGAAEQIILSRRNLYCTFYL